MVPDVVGATRAELVELPLQLADRRGHPHRLGRKERLGGPLALEVGGDCDVDRLTNDRGDGGAASAGSGLDTAIARLVEQDLEPPIEHVYTLACVGTRPSSGGELEQPERGYRVLEQQGRQTAVHARVLPELGDGRGGNA